MRVCVLLRLSIGRTASMCVFLHVCIKASNYCELEPEITSK